MDSSTVRAKILFNRSYYLSFDSVIVTYVYTGVDGYATYDRPLISDQAAIFLANALLPQQKGQPPLR
jgi:hypothetical protein